MDLRDEIYRKFVERAAPLFKVRPEELTEDKRFNEDLKAKSTQISQITTYLEDAFDIEIPYMTFRRNATVGEAVDYVLKLCSE